MKKNPRVDSIRDITEESPCVTCGCPLLEGDVVFRDRDDMIVACSRECFWAEIEREDAMDNAGGRWSKQWVPGGLKD